MVPKNWGGKKQCVLGAKSGVPTKFHHDKPKKHQNMNPPPHREKRPKTRKKRKTAFFSQNTRLRPYPLSSSLAPTPPPDNNCRMLFFLVLVELSPSEQLLRPTCTCSIPTFAQALTLRFGGGSLSIPSVGYQRPHGWPRPHPTATVADGLTEGV